MLLTDGLYSAALIAAALGYGLLLAPLLAAPPAGTLRRALLNIALGLGIVGVLALVLGIAGGLNRVTAWSILTLGMLRALAGALSRGVQSAPGPAGGPRSRKLAAVLAAPLGFPLGIMLIGASLPPGLIWKDEANGYDALEYHLQVQREYWDAGRIAFLPHNAYASFPQQTEVLYLLLMHLAGGPYAGAIPAQLLHAMLGVLAVAAVGAWAPERTRVAALLLVGGVPWLAYVGALAYVELAMLFFTAVAAGLCFSPDASGESASDRLLATGQRPAGGRSPNYDSGRFWATGLCAGLACGCKYTAVALVAAPLALCALGAAGSITQRLRRSLIIAAASLLSFSPWLVRNAAFTGNPVYPFAYEVFGGKAWSADQAAQWAAGHRPKSPDDSAPRRFVLAFEELSERSPYGIAVRSAIALLIVGALLLGSGTFPGALLWLIAAPLVWILFTHGPGRFALPLLIPLAWTLVDFGVRLEQRLGVLVAWRVFLIVALILSAATVVNAATLFRVFDDHQRRLQSRTQSDVRFNDLVGQTEALRLQMHVLNQLPTADTRIHLIGDAAVFYIDRPLHYTVVFNRDPLLELARGGVSPMECIAWLRTQGVSHLVFSWPEIERLRRTYGFPEVVTPVWSAALQSAGLRRSSLSTDQLEILAVPAAH
ncbi:hypothetical protein RAS1_39890 [Phycisphaerae bacterium RAS1]|nr:hypothetical protein RAS1_39890 [Phycisphaerae bacterium RAS1]